MQTNRNRLRQHVFHLADDVGERNVYRPHALRAAEEYLRSVWIEQGYEVRTQVYQVSGVRSANLEVTRPGSCCAGRTILLGAHYDTVRGSPGADDNASAVASLLELSRLFAVAAPGLSVRFVAFVNEEPPFCFTGQQGSVVYARSASRRRDDIWLMLSLEMLGYYRREPNTQRYPPFLRFFYPDRGDFIGFVSNLTSRGSLRKLVGAFRDASDFPVHSLAMPPIAPGLAWSDHRSFWRHGYKAVMVTDTAFYRNPHYHTPEDTAATLDYDALAAVTEGLFGAISRLAAVETQERFERARTFAARHRADSRS